MYIQGEYDVASFAFGNFGSKNLVLLRQAFQGLKSCDNGDLIGRANLPGGLPDLEEQGRFEIDQLLTGVKHQSKSHV